LWTTLLRVTSDSSKGIMKHFFIRRHP
jgi:hypothetical protein